LCFLDQPEPGKLDKLNKSRLFRFLMDDMIPAKRAILFECQFIRSFSFILRG
jgi:hypothetical protein